MYSAPCVLPSAQVKGSQHHRAGQGCLWAHARRHIRVQWVLERGVQLQAENGHGGVQLNHASLPGQQPEKGCTFACRARGCEYSLHGLNPLIATHRRHHEGKTKLLPPAQSWCVPPPQLTMKSLSVSFQPMTTSRKMQIHRGMLR